LIFFYAGWSLRNSTCVEAAYERKLGIGFEWRTLSCNHVWGIIFFMSILVWIRILYYPLLFILSFYVIISLLGHLLKHVAEWKIMLLKLLKYKLTN
jgi:hypothetical protein